MNIDYSAINADLTLDERWENAIITAFYEIMHRYPTHEEYKKYGGRMYRQKYYAFCRRMGYEKTDRTSYAVIKDGIIRYEAIVLSELYAKYGVKEGTIRSDIVRGCQFEEGAIIPVDQDYFKDKIEFKIDQKTFRLKQIKQLKNR